LNSTSIKYYPASAEAAELRNYKEIGFMHILRFLGLVLLSFMLSASPTLAETNEKAKNLSANAATNQQQTVE